MLPTDESTESSASPQITEQTSRESTRREFVLGTLAVSGLVLTSKIGSASEAAETPQKRPNLVFFYGETLS
jgi:hypothetical protein